ncbi:MAG: 2-amino-4-hydroxy-6-hydroxymethyldihydropteridine diphosphokinase [Gammaproteobacteria bacterium]|nr:2-amino-4-hydroxy-6-hydroxymethyldihydropteridine diphosphokinase [Gammaproteobacteria bacterium]
MAESVYIGLGSNLENPVEQIKAAVVALKQIPETQYIADSGLYLSKPLLIDDVESDDQDDYYNAVALLDTRLEPLVLLDYLQAIENNQGRIREQRWAARTLDLDMLMYAQLQMNKARLILPHPGICVREFVLYPLHRLCQKMQQPDLNIPGHGTLNKIINSCSENELKYVGEIV